MLKISKLCKINKSSGKNLKVYKLLAILKTEKMIYNC